MTLPFQCYIIHSIANLQIKGKSSAGHLTFKEGHTDFRSASEEKERQMGVTASATHNLMSEHAAVNLKPHLQASPPPPGIRFVWVTRRPSDLYTITSFSSHDFTFSMLHHTFHCKFANKGEKLSWSFDLQRRSHRFQECLGRKGEANGRDSKCHSYIYIYTIT